jgi:hypothetical protein
MGGNAFGVHGKSWVKRVILVFRFTQEAQSLSWAIISLNCDCRKI